MTYVPEVITGAHGPWDLPDGVRFEPTSRIGDGVVHVNGRFMGTVYADVRYPEGYAKPDKSVSTFTALDAAYQPAGAFQTQREAIKALVRG